MWWINPISPHNVHTQPLCLPARLDAWAVSQRGRPAPALGVKRPPVSTHHIAGDNQPYVKAQCTLRGIFIQHNTGCWQTPFGQQPPFQRSTVMPPPLGGWGRQKGWARKQAPHPFLPAFGPSTCVVTNDTSSKGTETHKTITLPLTDVFACRCLAAQDFGSSCNIYEDFRVMRMAERLATCISHIVLQEGAHGAALLIKSAIKSIFPAHLNVHLVSIRRFIQVSPAGSIHGAEILGLSWWAQNGVSTTLSHLLSTTRGGLVPRLTSTPPQLIGISQGPGWPWTWIPFGCLFLPTFHQKDGQQRREEAKVCSCRVPRQRGGRVYLVAFVLTGLYLICAWGALPRLGRGRLRPQVVCASSWGWPEETGAPLPKAAAEKGTIQKPPCWLCAIWSAAHIQLCCWVSFVSQIGNTYVSWYVALVQLLDKQGKRYNTFWSTLKKTLTWHEVSVHASIHPPEISISCLGSKWILRAIKTSAGVWLAFIHSYCPLLSPTFHRLMYKAQYFCLTHQYLNFCSIVFSFACS